jgi:hypothetical protein
MATAKDNIWAAAADVVTLPYRALREHYRWSVGNGADSGRTVIGIPLFQGMLALLGAVAVTEIHHEVFGTLPNLVTAITAGVTGNLLGNVGLVRGLSFLNGTPIPLMPRMEAFEKVRGLPLNAA